MSLFGMQPPSVLHQQLLQPVRLRFHVAKLPARLPGGRPQSAAHQRHLIQLLPEASSPQVLSSLSHDEEMIFVVDQLFAELDRKRSVHKFSQTSICNLRVAAQIHSQHPDPGCVQVPF